jgi:hypothetical protein
MFVLDAYVLVMYCIISEVCVFGLEENNVSVIITLVIFSIFSPSSAGSHFQWTCSEKWKILHFSKNWPLSVRCMLTIRARTSGKNFAKFDQRVYVLGYVVWNVTCLCVMLWVPSVM